MSHPNARPDIDWTLLVPGNVVKIRYATTQWDSKDGREWRSAIEILKPARLVSLPFRVRKVDQDLPGWWVRQGGKDKFFLKSRILDVEQD